jgi:heme-degrading monooxygenase HmoA
MILIRNCFTAKPGMASKLAAQFKEAAPLFEGMKGLRVMTDLTGDFNRVVLEYQVDSITDFETRMKEYGSNNAFREKMKGYTDLYVTGYREILNIL